jgi:ATP-dependent DNA ligase
MKINISKLKQSNNYLKGHLDCLDESIRNLPEDFKKKLSQQFLSVNSTEIDSRIKGNNFIVSKKMDGHLQLIIFDDDLIFMVGRNGTVRMNIPCLDQMKVLLKEKNITNATIACELYVQRENQRSRVYDVSAALSEADALDTLALAVFDIVEMDNKKFRGIAYDEIWKKITEIFPSEGKVHAVETRKVKSRQEVRKIFDEWVTEAGHEGLVVRGDMPFMFKVKPKYTFDGVVVGYTEGINTHKGKIKSLLVGFYRDNKMIQVAGKVGTNFSEEDRNELFAYFSKKHCDSTYIETDNDGIAFHMVTPDTVVEIGCNDVMIENTYGKPLLNNLLQYEDNTYSRYATIAGVRFIYPVFERIRDDKSPGLDDSGILQLKDFIDLSSPEKQTSVLPESDVLMRKVYKKTQKDKVMVQKFMVWKTNKETVDSRYPAYVLFYTNFSSQRKEPLQTDIRISIDKEQILALAESFILKNVKKGWKLFEK